MHSRYPRRLADAPLAGQQATIVLRVRRFFCDNPVCPARTFAEQITGLSSAYARRTPVLMGMLAAIALALAGRAGARLARVLGMSVGRDSLLRLVRALPDPPTGPVTVLGVDDFALRRGHVYGSILVDMATHRPVEVLEGRAAGPLAAWLRAHPGAEVICRDRAGAYAEGARAGAPDAVQVADRWHLWHNLAGHVEKTVLAHRGCVRACTEPPADPTTDPTTDPAPVPDPPGEPVVAPAQELTIVARTRERHRAVTELAATGASISAISRQLGLDRRTVRRFVRATGLEELQVKTLQRPSLLDGHTDYLHRRWAQGACDAAVLSAEITAHGYRGSDQTVRRYLHPLRDGRPAPPARPAAPTVREVTGWLLRPTAALESGDQVRLKQVLAGCPHIEATAGHVTGFAEMMTGRHGDRLTSWIAAVEADDLPELRRFTAGLARDRDAVVAGLTLEHSSGAVEGTVNRIKMLKRQMFGRAGFDLLRKRVLLST